VHGATDPGDFNAKLPEQKWFVHVGSQHSVSVQTPAWHVSVAAGDLSAKIGAEQVWPLHVCKQHSFGSHTVEAHVFVAAGSLAT